MPFLVVLASVLIVLTAVGVLVAIRIGDRDLRRHHAEPGVDGAAEPTGGPYLHWIPDRSGGWRLGGEFVPEQAPPQSAAPRRGTGRAPPPSLNGR